MLGTGSVSGEHIKAFQQNPHTRVVALLSRDRERARAKARAFALEDCRCCTSLDEVLADSGVHIVSICTPHHLHVPQGIAAARSGKHLVVEKPIAIDLAGLRSLACAVREAGVRSVVSFVLRWNPLFENIKAMLAGGLIGRVFYGEVDYHHPVDRRFSLYDWIRLKQYGGSNLLTGGCHAVDALRWFMGQDAVEVTGYANYGHANRLDYEYETNSVTILKFAGGEIGKVACSLECVAPYTFPITLMGDAGTIRNNQVFTARWPGQTDWATIPTILPDTAAVEHHPFYAQMNHLVECILGGRESHCSVEDAVNTHEICLASGISAREGRPVRLPLP